MCANQPHVSEGFGSASTGNFVAPQGASRASCLSIGPRPENIGNAFEFHIDSVENVSTGGESQQPS